MAYNPYIMALQKLRREFEMKIDNEIEETMRGKPNCEHLKESLEYMLETSNVLNGYYDNKPEI